MLGRSLFFGAAIAVLGTACTRQTPLEPAAAPGSNITWPDSASSVNAVRPQYRVGDVGGDVPDIQGLLAEDAAGDIPGAGFLLTTQNGDAIGGGILPSGVALSAPFLSGPQNAVSGQSPAGCFPSANENR